MRRFHDATISVFLRDAEPAGFLDQLLPVPLERFYKVQYRNDPDQEGMRIYDRRHERLTVQEAQGFSDPITIIKASFTKIKDTEDIFKTILKGLCADDKKQLSQDVLTRVDEHGRLYMRLHKPSFEKGVFELTDGGDCVHVSFLIAAYPKNPRTIREAVKNLF